MYTLGAVLKKLKEESRNATSKRTELPPLFRLKGAPFIPAIYFGIKGARNKGGSTISLEVAFLDSFTESGWFWGNVYTLGIVWKKLNIPSTRPRILLPS